MNSVALKTALQDFEGTTLAAIQGLLARLHYLAGLREERGSYSHWGMERIYGESAAQRAIRASHAAVLTQVLRTPLRALEADLKRSASGTRISDSQFLSTLIERLPRALPDAAGAPSRRHLTAVMHALSALLASRERANRPNA